jgi:hypothetical protein
MDWGGGIGLMGFGFLGEDFPDFTFVLVTSACLRAFVAFTTVLVEFPPY